MKVLVLILACVLLSWNTQSNSKIIIWSKDYKLQFSDFTLTNIPLEGGSTALTSTGIFLDRDKSTPSTWKAVAVFDKKESLWYINRNKSFDSLVLHHEQIHFDISNHFAKLLDAELQRLGKSLNRETLKMLYEIYIRKMDSLQIIHDTSPGFRRDSASQRKWNLRMDSLLAK